MPCPDPRLWYNAAQRHEWADPFRRSPGLGLGKLYRSTGHHQRAHEHLTTATAMYREMDMRFWLEQAEAEQNNQPSLREQENNPK
jgi:hypothetical protein